MGSQWSYETTTPLKNPDANGHNAWWGSAVNPMAGKWAKVEIAFKVTDQKDGWIKVWENGKQVVNYSGPTDTYNNANRSVGIGGYARMQGYPDNWRYFADAYVDTTLAHVVLANASTLAKASIIENQIPSSWADGSITATVNLGQFKQGETAYLFVFDSSGLANSSGAAVTVGGGRSAGVITPSALGSAAVH
jgi:hypothetical protein